MVQQPQRFSGGEQPLPPPIQLSELAGYQSFGAYLKTKREQLGVSQPDMVGYLLEHGQSQFSRLAYLRLEAGRRAPQLILTGKNQMNEVIPIFTILVELHRDKRLPAIPVIEAKTFFLLAKKRILEKGKKCPTLTAEQWGEIEQTLIGLADGRQTTLQVVPNTATSLLIQEPADSRRRQALGKLLDLDTSHLLEREEWADKVSTYPDKDPQMKVVVVQGAMGAGKSRAQALLAQRLAPREDLFLIPYLFKHSETMTANDHLDTFLATLLSDLTMKATDEAKQRPLAERIEQVLKIIRTLDQKVVVLLDDAQEMFPLADSWSAAWHQFFETWIDQPHQSTLYVFTRTWPGWDKRERQFLTEDDLPDLSIESGIILWKRQEFDDVEDDLLRKVCVRTGMNPQVIEMLAYQYRRRGFARKWGIRGNTSERAGKNPNTASLETLLESETLFAGNLDKSSRETLQQVFSNQLSGDTVKLMECLALAPLGIPFDLLFDHFDHADESFENLVKASFADLSVAATGRAAVVPLVREAVIQSLTVEQKAEVEQLVTGCYAQWLNDLQDFRDDAEKAALIAEMVVRYLRARQLLDAADLFVGFSWLCTLFGQVPRIQRVYEEVVRADRGKEEDIQHEVGRLLLQHRIKVSSGQGVERDWRDQIYRGIYEKIVAGEVVLQPHSGLEVLHNMLLFYSRNERLVEASAMFDQTLERLQHSGKMTPEVYALFLGNKTRLLAHWWDQVGNKHNQEEVQHLRQKCIAALKESITQWQLCLKNALPLQEQYYNFKLGRVLNDYAYRLRLVGDLDRAEEAIKESLCLKKASHTLPHSIAISLSEHAQILALKGDIRKALPLKEEAITTLEDLNNKGDTSHNSELGVFLFEHAKILKMQARLEEAKAELERAIPLIGNKPARQHFLLEAGQELKEISFILETGQHYQLDKRWFSRYLELASYNEVDWIVYAGPFSESEQEEWESLYPQREKAEVSARLKSLLVQSQQREFALSQEAKRAPRLWYPHIPLEEVQERLKGLSHLQHEIETQEANAVVRSLYMEAIDEQILRLRQYEATVLGNQDAVWQCNLSLYGKPSTHEFSIALQALCKMVLEAQSHEQAGPVAQDILRQLKIWGLAPHDIAAMEFFSSGQEPVPSFKQKLVDGEREFSPTVVQQFFQDVLTQEYHVDNWSVEIEPTRTGAGVDVNARKLFLPPKPFSLDKIRELLAEEVEVHAYRSFSGRQSPLALLGSGLAQYSMTEEGLAKHSVQQVAQYMHSEERGKTWIWTLTTGLASGILTPPLSFYELVTFLEKRFLIEQLLSSKLITWDKAVAAARQLAWSRAARTFRGVPHLEDAGCCSLKDVIYLRGYLTVKQKLEQVEEQRLFVGKIGAEHLDAMSELNILVPFCPHHHLALAPDLFDRVVQYEK